MNCDPSDFKERPRDIVDLNFTRNGKVPIHPRCDIRTYTVRLAFEQSLKIEINLIGLA
jgi:hypothetical protein